jgi:hypothetical protein
MAAKGPSIVPFSNVGSSVLPPRNQMTPGQYLESPNKQFRLSLQGDMNLVLHNGDSLVWVADANQPHSRTLGNPVRAVANSFYVFYSAVLVDHTRTRYWQTINSTPLDGNVTAASERTVLQVQDDGNLVIIDSIPVWASNTSVPVSPDQPGVLVPPGTIIHPGQTFSVGTSTLTFQADGNLVLLGAGGVVLWHAGTGNKGAALATMQGDGNFVISDGAGSPIWYTNTGAFPGAYGRIQANGSFSIVTDRVVWARFGHTPTVKARAVFYPNHGTGPLPTFYDRVLYTFS